MITVKPKSTCQLCNGAIAKGATARHLQKCREEHAEKVTSKTPCPVIRTFQIVVEGSPVHWLHIEAAADAKLFELDGFLRDVWLECCGHLSDFKIGNTVYSVSPDTSWQEERSMKEALSKVLRPDLKFRHTYDYGSTTELMLRVVSEREAAFPTRTIQLQARNEPLQVPCETCGQPATFICTECKWDGGGFYCKRCLTKHSCGDEMALPVVNSPRCGVCGYTGAD